MKYKVVPLNQSKNPPQELQRIIDEGEAKGWKYVNHQYSHYLKPGSDGCFGIGSRPDQVWHIGMIVFETT